MGQWEVRGHLGHCRGGSMGKKQVGKSEQGFGLELEDPLAEPGSGACSFCCALPDKAMLLFGIS